ncbi:MAG: tRNA lysidine(34) synthetase TilS [Tannerellaceae bacterium]|jgi:tRNA(Ile)-lysidine synthase|nr:tRNA lysidine(34) synthetase TilS [Tannerellaceae bacterium]
MLSVVHTYIHQNHLLSDNEKPVIVGFSGGSDSVTLLTVLLRLGYACVAVHCNFHLREKESDRDEAFAKDFAHTLNVPFYKTDFNTRQYASEKHISLEMAARELRYQWFEEIRERLDAQAVAVAHHKDDNVETFLMNLIRGTGIKGMRGMKPKNGFVIRPLLAVGKKEIQKWLETEHLTYVTDSSNFSNAYTRNFIRLNVLPVLEEINPSVREAITRTFGHLSEVEVIYQFVIEKAKRDVLQDNNRNRIDIAGLLQFPSPETILYELLIPFHFTRFVTENIFAALEKTPGKVFYSSTHRLIKDRTHLLILPIENTNKTIYTIALEENETIWYGPVNLSFRKTMIEESTRIDTNKCSACFDYDKLSFPLTLRTWQPGDRFVPFGMKGTKKLSDYFSDRKYSRPDKEQTWLLCSGEYIIWIVGERIDERFKVNETTKHILSVNFFRQDAIYI